MTQHRTLLAIEPLETLERAFHRLCRSVIDEEPLNIISRFEALGVEKKCYALARLILPEAKL